MGVIKDLWDSVWSGNGPFNPASIRNLGTTIDSEVEQVKANARPRATTDQAIAGTSNDVLMTPVRTVEQVNNRRASMAQAIEGEATGPLMTPVRVRQHVDGRIATEEEAKQAESNSRIMSALRTRQQTAALHDLNPGRPGELPDRFTTDLIGSTLDAESLPADIAVTDTDGRAVRIVGPGRVATRSVFRIEPGRRYRVRFAVRRRVDSPDPSGDAVVLAIRWLNRFKGGIALGGVAHLLEYKQENGNELTAVAGRRTFSAVVSIHAAENVDFIAPASAIYFRPYVEQFGSAGVETDIEVVQVTDITDAIDFSPDVSEIESRVGALESLEVGDRLTAVEAVTTGAEIARFKTRALAELATIPASVDIVETLGDEVDDDGRVGIFVRRGSEPDDGFQSADGAWWERVVIDIDVFVTNPNGEDYTPRALDNVIGEGNVRLRDVLGDGVTPTPTEWREAMQKAHDDLKSVTGTVWFSEPVQFDAIPVLWDGFVSLKGTGYSIIHRFAHPEPFIGAVILGPQGQSLGNEDFGWGGGFNQPNGLINIKLDVTILDLMSSRPRANTYFENFGIYGNQMTLGSGLRNVGTMYVNFRNLSLAFLPTWGLNMGSRGDISPGSPNGCRAEDLLITSCGANSDITGGMNWLAPDSHFENIQAGGNSGLGVRVNAGNVSAEQLNIWNNIRDGMRIVGSHHVQIGNILAYENGRNNVALLSGCHHILLSGVLMHPNVSARTESTESANLYLDASSQNISLSGINASGDMQILAYSSFTQWAQGQTVAVGDRRVNANKRYRAATAGTTGSTAPTHITGTVSDGGVNWTFESGYGLYGLYAPGNTGRLNIDGATAFVRHRVEDWHVRTPNVFGPMRGQRTFLINSSTPATMWSAGEDDAMWNVIATRSGSFLSTVKATIIGGPSPVIFDKVQHGSGVDLAVSGSNIQLATPEGSTITVHAKWERIR